jgi:glycogen debranching enzyme
MPRAAERPVGVRQPFLHDLVTCVQAPTQVLSDRNGQIREQGVQGVLHGDLRVLSRAELLVDGTEPVGIAGGPVAGAAARFSAVVRGLGDPGADPTVRVERERRIRAGGLDEEIRVVSTALGPVSTEVSLLVAADLAPLGEIRGGLPRRPTVGPEIAPGGTLRWSDRYVEVELTAPAAAVRPAARAAEGTRIAEDVEPDGGVRPVEGAAEGAGPDDGLARLCWRVELPGPGERVLRWSLAVRDRSPVLAGPEGGPGWSRPQVRADDPRLAALLERALDDLAGLRLATPQAPDDAFLGAGAPWYLTLFGRDSLWAARMLLPLGTALAGGTLRALAARQGRRTDRGTGEAPGKIMHELRRPDLRPWTAGGGAELRLPPLYYGTVDATPLWVCLLHDAWRWGLAEDEVAALLPHTEAALGWLAADGDPDGDGFLEYLDPTGHGLANQGWKDSPDAVRFADGTRAVPPVALCEVQGYAYEAARHGADLLEAFGRPGAHRWRQWAADLAGAFRERFWVDAPAGRYPALALDGAKRPADVVTSNIGHLLGTGLLDQAESALVAHRVVAADLDSGYGLRTMSAGEVAYAPLSYHCGSVWPHDTAIVLHGLSRSGHGDLAGPLIEGLLAAGAAFGYRLPELYAGDGREQAPRPVPYPGACRPQAWSAAAAVSLLQVLLGLHVDVPRGRLLLRPVRPQPTGTLSVTGLQAGGQPVRVGLVADGTVTGVFAGGLTAVTVDTADHGPG